MEEKTRGVFHGEAYRIKLISNNQGYGPMPDPAQEIEQRLTLSSTGRVWLSGYGMNMDRCYGDYNSPLIVKSHQIS